MVTLNETIFSENLCLKENAAVQKVQKTSYSPFLITPVFKNLLKEFIKRIWQISSYILNHYTV